MFKRVQLSDVKVTISWDGIVTQRYNCARKSLRPTLDMRGKYISVELRQ